MKQKRIVAFSNKTSLTFRKLPFCGLNSLTHSLTFIHTLINQNHSLLNLFDFKSNLHINVYKSSYLVYFIACPFSVLRDVYIKWVSLNRGLTVYFMIKLSKSSQADWSRAIIYESIDHGNDVTCHTGN